MSKHDFNTGAQEWYTSDEYLDAIRNVFGHIDLDPASSIEAQKRVQAKTFYTMKDDGLTQDWKGKTYLNPPYTRYLIDKFVAKLLHHYKAGDIKEAIVMANNASETVWFQSLLQYSDIICLPKKRVQFVFPDNKAGIYKRAHNLQGQCIFGFNVDPLKFREEFRGFGTLLFPLS